MKIGQYGIRMIAGIMFFPMLGLAQGTDPSPAVMEAAWEDLAESSGSETEDDEWWQQMEGLRKHPAALNKVTAEELSLLPMLTSRQVQSLLEYRRLLGDFISIYELQAVPGLDMATIRGLLPYVKVSGGTDSYTLKDYFREGDHSLLLRYARYMEKSRGFKANGTGRPHYLGDPNKILFRYRYNFTRHLSYGITAEKDAGEEFFKGSQPAGFDFYSAHFFLKNYKSLYALAIGDFSVNLGQGLMNWQSLAFKKSASVLNIKRSSPVLQPYTSAGETFFFRGAGATLKKGKWEASFFASYKAIDANTLPSDTADTSPEGISSLLTSGYHRTLGEIADKHAIRQATAGGNAGYQGSGWYIGANVLHHNFSAPLIKKEEPYNLFAFSGRQLTNVGLHYTANYRNLYFFGETAMSDNGAPATVNGLLVSADPKIDIALLYRNFDKAYQSIYANAFSESSRPQDESGLYTAVSVKLSKYLQLDAYTDFFSFSWLKYRLNAPVDGNDHLLQLTWQPSKKLSAYGRYRLKHKPVNGVEASPVRYPVNTELQEGRVQGAYQLNHGITLRSQAGIKYYKLEPHRPRWGWMFAQDLLYKKRNGRWGGNLRFAYFNTDGYDTRIYAYENDVLFAYSVPFFYDQGIRYYANLHYKFSKKLSGWMRFTQTAYFNVSSIGNGWDEIPGNKKSEIKLQCRYEF